MTDSRGPLKVGGVSKYGNAEQQAIDAAAKGSGDPRGPLTAQDVVDALANSGMLGEASSSLGAYYAIVADDLNQTIARRLSERGQPTALPDTLREPIARLRLLALGVQHQYTGPDGMDPQPQIARDLVCVLDALDGGYESGSASVAKDGTP